MTSAEADPAYRLEMADSLSLAFLVLLESLSPQQRAAFLLREVFDEPYDRIAQIIDTSEQNVRQLVARGRRRMRERRPRFESSPEQMERLAACLFAAAESGDLEALEELLAHDVVLRADSGGKAPAIRRAVHGRTQVARLLATGLRARAHVHGITLRREQVNGQPGALFFDPDGRVASIVALDITEGQIQTVSLIVNPDKLRRLGPVADLRALLRDRQESGSRRQGPR